MVSWVSAETDAWVWSQRVKGPTVRISSPVSHGYLEFPSWELVLSAFSGGHSIICLNFQVLTPGPQNVTASGDGVFTEVA